MSGSPAATVCAGLSESGLPVGLQLVGPWLAEERLLRLAAVLETIAPWHERRPPNC
jgi:aspartyl-tRNA(Asn)/glutamyl-tRNA(Gln) amidotransferase subunit A